MDSSDSNEAPPKRSWLKRSLYALGGVKLLIILILTVIIMWLPNERLTAPEWARVKIVVALQGVMPSLQFEIGRVDLYVDEKYQPTLAFSQIALRDSDGGALAQINTFEMRLARRALLQGDVRAKTLYLSGARAAARRSDDGALNLSFSAEADQAKAQIWAAGLDPVEVPIYLDQLFAHPMLEQVVDAQLDDLTIRYEDLITKQAWGVDGARMRATRAGVDISIAMDMALLSGDADVGLIELNLSHKTGKKSLEFGANFENLPAKRFSDQAAALAWLSVLRAPVSGAIRLSLNEAGDLQPIFATLQLNKGVIQPTETTKPVPFENARIYMDYKPKLRELTLSDITVDSAWINMQAEAHAKIDLSELGLARAFEGAVKINRLSGNPDGIFAQSQQIDKGQFDFKLELAPFSVKIGQLRLYDEEENLSANGTILAKPQGWQINIDGALNKISHKKLMAFWPAQIKPKTRKWLNENILQGQAQDVTFAIRLDEAGQLKKYINLQFEDVDLRYLKTMPLATNASGHLELIDRRLQIYTQTGLVRAPNGGVINVSGTKFIVPQMQPKDAPAQVVITGRSELPALLSLLDLPPVNLLQRSALGPDLGQGQIAFELGLDFPLGRKLQMHEIKQNGRAVIGGFYSKKIVAGHVLAADELALALTDERVKIQGKAQFDGLPVSGQWELARTGPQKGAANLEAKLTLSPALLDKFNLSSVGELINGKAPLAAKIAFKPGKIAQINLQSDLIGVQADLPAVAWRKSKEDKLALNATIALSKPVVIESLTLKGEDIDSELSAEFLAENKGSKLQISRLMVGDHLEASANWSITPNVNKLDLIAKHIDLRPWMKAPRRHQGRDLALKVAAEELRLSERIALADMKAELTLGAQMNGDFSGKINNGEKIYGTISQPASKPLKLRLVANDAGQFLRDTGAVRSFYGGKLIAELTQDKNNKSRFSGPFVVSPTSLRGAPVMAELLNAISVIGLLEQLDGPGIKFNALKGTVDISPKKLTLTDANAVGASLGVSLEGDYDFDTNALDMAGVISPIYALNLLGAPLSQRQGEGLFGFNFTLKGAASDPKANVNLLSILVPGALRDLFRDGPADKLQKP